MEVKIKVTKFNHRLNNLNCGFREFLIFNMQKYVSYNFNFLFGLKREVVFRVENMSGVT